MNIGDVAEASGLPTKTIRYYDEIGLISPKRDLNGYRRFSDADLHKLRFMGRARSLGFSIEDCRSLLTLYDDKGRESAQVRKIAQGHLRRISEKIEELRQMEATLTHLVRECAGDGRPDCPILDDLARE